MNVEHVSIADFVRDDEFYEPIELVVTIKSFDLQAIRRRYIASRRENASGKVGSIERRDVGIGGVARVTLRGGTLTDERVVVRLLEPRGVFASREWLVVSAENRVLVIGDGEVRVIENPWFRYIHTVEVSADERRLLVSSSGFDCVFEHDLRTRVQTYEWFAWENGFDTATDPAGGWPIRLTRDAERARALSAQGERVTLIADPASQVLPTAMRAAFINSVTYDRAGAGGYLATLFHRGAVFRIDGATGEATEVLGGLTTPHGGRNFGGRFLAASTGSGEIVIGDPAHQIRYSVGDLPGKSGAVADLEWVQNISVIGDVLVAIDSNRCSFVVFDPGRRLYSVVPYNSDWAIQDLAPASLHSDQASLLESAGATLSTV